MQEQRKMAIKYVPRAEVKKRAAITEGLRTECCAANSLCKLQVAWTMAE